MNDEDKSKAQLIEDLSRMRDKFVEFDRLHVEHQRAQAAYQSVVEFSLQGLAIVQNQRIVFANPALSNLLGYSLEELLSLSSREVVALVHSEDRDTLWSRYRKRLAGKSVPPRSDVRVVRKDGSIRWVEIFASLIQYFDKPAVQVALMDITQRKGIENALRESEKRYRTLVEDMPALVCRFLPDGVLTFVNEHYCYYFKRTREELIGENFFQFIPSEDRDKVREHYASLTLKNPVITYEHQAIASDGTVRWQQWTDRALFDHSDRLVEYQSIGEDITHRKHAEQALKESEEKFRTLAEQSPNMIFINSGGKVVYANRRCEELMGYTREEYYADDFDFFDLIAPEYRQSIEENFTRHRMGEEIEPYEYALITKSGEVINAIVTTRLINYSGEKGILGVVTDITERKQLEEHLRLLASQDFLTNLPNRRLFMDRLSHALAKAKRYDHYVGVLFLDLDGFKVVNDTLGHEYGDRLLQSVAHRLKGCVREMDTIARMGGDEFSIILEEVDDLESVVTLAERVLRSFEEDFTFDGHKATITASIGISLYPMDGQEARDLLKCADFAMYVAKESGKNQYCLCDQLLADLNSVSDN